MKQYKLINNIVGWLAFVIAATTYCLTVEPTASFWDCPEFITTASKLEVGHPPGAPFFMLTGNFFTLFTSNPEHIAVCINVMSALLSAFCILFLFWTITHLARKLLCKDGIVTDTWQTVLIMGAGLTGALAYTWSDTFWFSAVEGEVYGYSSMFTALVFWLILKWEDHADEPHSDRWLVLIFYLTGLSIGVHLLNLLCLPAIALVYYFKKKPNANTSGSLCALGISMLLVVAVLYGVVPGIVKVGGWFELFFVNVMGMSFNTGLIIYILLLIAIVLAAIWSTTRNMRALIVVLYTLSVLLLGIPFFMGRSTMAIVIGLLLTCGLPVLLTMRRNGQYLLRKRFLNTSLLCMLMLMIGYSSYAVIVIRSTQNTPMDQNSPEDIFSLGTYLSREQYGDTPLFYGPAFSSTPCYEPVFNEETGQPMYMYMVKKSEAVVRHEKQNPNEPDRYDHMETNDGLQYPGTMKMLFPRMHSGAYSSHYQQWMGDITMHDVDATWTTSNGEEMSGEGQMPSQWDNIRFFTSYQVNFMYWRYFMWNFAGRQNDIQGHGNPDNGNWITGFSFIDNWLLGDQSKLPDDLKDNKGHNAFYCLPLLLGLLGLFWQAFKGQRGIQQFWVVFFLFFMTGLAIVMYLNQTPSQPRERDYAYAGSFYAFAIWIGLGAMALGDWLNKWVKNKPMPVAVGVSALSLLVPIQMVSQTWDDHDRSGRYACRDFGLNYLNTLPEGNMPIIFTNGDNDTFPLWYAQEVEGKRTDARVCNLSYLQTDWYTDQMKRQAYESAPLPIAWSRYEYVDNRGKGYDYFEVKPEMRSELDAIKQRTGVNTYDLKYIIDHYVRGRIAKGQPGVIPTDSVMVPVNKQAIIAQGTTLPGGKDSIPDYITIRFGNSVTKSQMMVYEMVARNDWKRPIYMSVTLGGDLTNSNYAGLGDYLVLEGLAYRLTPFCHARTADGRPNLVIDSEKMYDNMMNRFKYGNVAAKNIYLDETVMRMCSTHRNMFILLVKQLLNEGKTDKARKALEKCKQVLPPENIPYDDYDTDVVTAWLSVGNTKEAGRVALAIFKQAHDYLNWGGTLKDERQAHMMDKFRSKLSVLYRIVELKDRFDKDTQAKIDRLATQTEALSLVQTIYNNLEQRYNQPSSLPSFDLGGGDDDLGDF